MTTQNFTPTFCVTKWLLCYIMVYYIPTFIYQIPPQEILIYKYIYALTAYFPIHICNQTANL